MRKFPIALAASVAALPFFAATSSAQECTITVGRVVSMSGPLVDLGRETPWLDEHKIKPINAAGGLQVGNRKCKIAYKIFDSIRLLTRAMDMLRELCIDGITANEARCRELMENSIGLITALNPYIGYENATRIAKVALESGRGVLELVREEQLLDEATLADILRPENMIAPRLVPLQG